MKKNGLLVLGTVLIILGIVLNRVIADFPALLVALIHSGALVCFVLFIYSHYKNKGK